MDTTGKGLIEHCEWMIEKGLINPSTGRARKIASEAVLASLENWESVNVASVDPDDILTRFRNKRGRDFSPDSLETYGSRFRSALDSFVQYARDPGAWKPTLSKKGKKSTVRSANDHKPTSEASTIMSAPYESTRSTLVDYPFPIRDGLTARLILPRDLKAAEVKRLSAFMNTLAVDFDQG